MRGIRVLLVLGVLLFSPLFMFGSAEAIAGYLTFDVKLSADRYYEIPMNLDASEFVRVIFWRDSYVDVFFASLELLAIQELRYDHYWR